mmetsp:Transcript_27598/g.69912  ORF Transcript_27598/g.69912 Transcript_27598/m.69912 type:complete len:217 (-) Transcript_27598:231-881(-)
MKETTLAVAATSGTACFWCRSAARLAPLASRRMCWSSAMEEVRPLSDSCLCRSTRLRARPRPSSRKETGPVSTPTRVLLPASTLPTTATLRSRWWPCDGSLRTMRYAVCDAACATAGPSPSLSWLPSLAALLLPPSLSAAGRSCVCTTVQSHPTVCATSLIRSSIDSSSSLDGIGPTVTNDSPSASAASRTRFSHGSSSERRSSESSSGWSAFASA